MGRHNNISVFSRVDKLQQNKEANKHEAFEKAFLIGFKGRI